MRKRETRIDTKACEKACVGPFKPAWRYSSWSQRWAQRTLVAAVRTSKRCVSCLCHSRWSWLQTQHSSRPCRGASCRGVWSEIRDGFNRAESVGQCVSTCVFQSEPRCFCSSLNKCGLIPLSPLFQMVCFTTRFFMTFQPGANWKTFFFYFNARFKLEPSLNMFIVQLAMEWGLNQEQEKWRDLQYGILRWIWGSYHCTLLYVWSCQRLTANKPSAGWILIW